MRMGFTLFVLLHVSFCFIHAQTISFYSIDAISKNNVQADSVAITRLRDKVRITTKGSSVNFSTVDVPTSDLVQASMSVHDNVVRLDGFTSAIRCQLLDVTGASMDLHTIQQGQTSIAYLPDLPLGWHGLIATDGQNTIHRTMYSDPSSHAQISVGKAVEESQTADDYYAVVYAGSFVSAKYYFSFDPAKPKIIHIEVDRPRWMANVIAVDVYEDRFPSNLTYHSDLYPSSLRSGQTYIWSFTKDSASYTLSSVDRSPCCQVCYIQGDENTASRIIYYTMRMGYDVYDVTLKERPIISGKTVTICGTASMSVNHSWEEFNYSTNQLEPRTSAGGSDRCIVFTLK